MSFEEHAGRYCLGPFHDITLQTFITSFDRLTHQRFAVSCNESAVPLPLLSDDSVEVKPLLVLSLTDSSLRLLQQSEKLG